MKHQFQNMKDQFNGKIEKMHHPLHLTGHEVYEMVKDVYVVLGKRKRTSKNIDEDGLREEAIDLMEATVLERFRCQSFD
jgi:hypothetical protein